MKLFEAYKKLLFELNKDEILYEYFDIKMEVLNDILLSIKNKKKYRYNRIDPNVYKKALTEFVKYGQFFRFPEKYIFQWKNLMIKNTAMLESFNEIYGHARNFPYEEFYEIFDIPEEEQNFNFLDAYEKLESYNIDEYTPYFSNGQPAMSDYGLEPLIKLTYKLFETEEPEEIIVLINKMLDVSHQRSDLPEIYIKGGSSSLDYITFDKTINENKIKLFETFNELFSDRLTINDDNRIKRDQEGKPTFNTVYLNGEPIVDIVIGRVGKIKDKDGFTIENTLEITQMNSVVQKKGYGKTAIKFLFNKLPKIENIYIQCYKDAFGFWKKIGGEIVKEKNTKHGKEWTMIINRNKLK